MLGTLTWRLKEALAVLKGEKKTTLPVKKSDVAAQSYQHLEEYVFTDAALQEFINGISIEFCFSEFGENRVNAGGTEFQGNRLDPSFSTLKKYFPNAKYTVYSDFDLEIPGVKLKKVIASPIQDDEHPRHFYRIADYFKFKSLLESDADFRCVIDTDMFVFSEEIYRLIYLTQIFGACAPYNSRNLLKKDMKISLDALEISDETKGLGHSYNQSPMTLWKNHEQGEAFYQACCQNMIKEPSRASRVMWNAAKQTGFSPYLLPAEWCVCAEDVGIGNEILLHVGHAKVADFYNIKL